MLISLSINPDKKSDLSKDIQVSFCKFFSPIFAFEFINTLFLISKKSKAINTIIIANIKVISFPFLCLIKLVS